MQSKPVHQRTIRRSAIPVMLIAGIMSGLLAGPVRAQDNPPTTHNGLEVEQLGFVPAGSMEKQTGLNGHELLLRRITINPGGQIARHNHESVPGVVYMESGEWIEGRDSGEPEISELDGFIEDAKHSRISSPGIAYMGRSETTHSAGETFIEDSETIHWFFNRGDEPATAYVCDIKKS